MQYKNGRALLPDSLLAELQKYVEGELIYIPKASQKRAGWGEKNGTRKMLASRNRKIYAEYHRGVTRQELVLKYNLSEDSIKKIIYRIERSEKLIVKA